MRQDFEIKVIFANDSYCERIVCAGFLVCCATPYFSVDDYPTFDTFQIGERRSSKAVYKNTCELNCWPDNSWTSRCTSDFCDFAKNDTSVPIQRPGKEYHEFINPLDIFSIIFNEICIITKFLKNIILRTKREKINWTRYYIEMLK